MRRRTFLQAAALLLPSGGLRAQVAGEWPTRAVRFILPFAVGGATDALARLLMARLATMTGQPFVVDNRSGAAGIIGTDAIAKSAPDGYTIGLGTIAVHAIAPTLHTQLPFDAGRDFTMICGLYQGPNMLVVNREVPANTLAELVELLRRSPGKYFYASSGPGTTMHLTAAMFEQAIGAQMVHVPYRGTAQALTDLLAGRVHLMFDNLPNAIIAVSEGRVRPLAVTGAARSPVAPDVPTVAETVPGFEMQPWAMLVGPAGIPSQIVVRIAELTRQALQSDEMLQTLTRLGAETAWRPPAETAAFRAEQEALLAPIIRASGARVD